MISPQEAVDAVLAAAAKRGRADETIVLVTDRSDTALRWAGNSMTTNGDTLQPPHHRHFDCATG